VIINKQINNNENRLLQKQTIHQQKKDFGEKERYFTPRRQVLQLVKTEHLSSLPSSLTTTAKFGRAEDFSNEKETTTIIC
jgi:hypothetical protein